jgi:hypothetical protein
VEPRNFITAFTRVRQEQEDTIKIMDSFFLPFPKIVIATGPKVQNLTEMQKPLAAGSQDSRSLLTQFLRKWNL